ncbi:VIT1/CCC1 transporter family protein [Methylophilus medardicus]|uniref:VIT family protein n=1 Tax=Methylophilus medardicus TaxID=2588534 RepID=A0A5B8CSE4_9PROT|nr:VIT family protein [Methylophilus medardicus]QDC43785.1 VIT family protein [Methylophilus medardicus]QDC48792.1 VIT family protein [Methylophilus medardicus]QDC52497.1 VIT family protein [Methylophilus medardicus]
MAHHERHLLHRSGWLRAAVLGANDGIISTASLLMGVAAAGANHQALLMTGIAGLVAGALSMAAGEYVSVSSQTDIEQADLAREAEELQTNPDSELRELTAIYTQRGLSPALAAQVAQALSEHDSLAAHARDELGLHDMNQAQPLQAALASAFAFSSGAALPLITAWLAPHAQAQSWFTVSTLPFLALLGIVAADTGGASRWKSVSRVVLWGALAMAATALIGHWFGVTPV